MAKQLGGGLGGLLVMLTATGHKTLTALVGRDIADRADDRIRALMGGISTGSLVGAVIAAIGMVTATPPQLSFGYLVMSMLLIGALGLVIASGLLALRDFIGVE